MAFFVLNQENRFVYGEFNVYDTYEVTLKVFEDDVELEMVSVEPFRSTPEILSVKSKGNTEYIYQPDSYVGVASRMHQRWIQNV